MLCNATGVGNDDGPSSRTTPSHNVVQCGCSCVDDLGEAYTVVDTLISP